MNSITKLNVFNTLNCLTQNRYGLRHIYHTCNIKLTDKQIVFYQIGRTTGRLRSKGFAPTTTMFTLF